jgi:hypothetical protein
MQEIAMAESKERRKAPRKAAPKPDGKAVAPRKTTAEERSPAMGTLISPGQSPEQSPDEVRKQIEEAAYYRAKQRGFEPGRELDDWIEAESDVRRRNGPPQ